MQKNVVRKYVTLQYFSELITKIPSKHLDIQSFR